jgi:hypothetical protein
LEPQSVFQQPDRLVELKGHMNEKRAHLLAQQAIEYLRTAYPEVLAWAENVGPNTFRNLKEKRFLADYCWVVYASGFKFTVIEAIFPALRVAFKDFEPGALSRMRSLAPVLEVFNNERKATSFLAGAKAIHKEGFVAFKRRLRKEGVATLENLPGIGPITKDHLAKNIGLADVAKADIWLERASNMCEAASVTELTAYLSTRLGVSQHVIDVAIWQYGADGKFASVDPV